MGPKRRRVVQLGEEVLQGLLADLADALGRQGELAALAIDETLVLQSLEGLLETLDVARGVVTEVAPHRIDVDLGQALGGAGASEELFEVAQVAQLLGDRSGLGERGAVLAAHAVRPTPVDVGGRLAQVRDQPVEREIQFHVLHHLGEQRAQLALLFARERVEHRLGGGGTLGHGAHHVLEVLGTGKEVAELVHEVLEAGIERFAATILLDHRRKRVHHVAHPLQLLGVGTLEELLALFEVGVEDVGLEFGHQLLELLAGLRGDEVVVLVTCEPLAQSVTHEFSLQVSLFDQVTSDLFAPFVV